MKSSLINNYFLENWKNLGKNEAERVRKEGKKLKGTMDEGKEFPWIRGDYSLYSA